MGAAQSSPPASTGLAIPPQCNIPASYDVSAFTFFNSSHNLECLEYAPNTDFYSQGCLNAAGQWCDPNSDGCTNCDIDYCGAGVPTQPLGYGPPDSVYFDFTNGLSCFAADSAGPDSREVGNGIVPCGGQELLQFLAHSIHPTSSARAYIVPNPTTCSNGSIIRPTYDATFDLSCAYDQGGNATCTSVTPLSLPLTSYTIQ